MLIKNEELKRHVLSNSVLEKLERVRIENQLLKEELFMTK
jgi:hypothetical protein